MSKQLDCSQSSIFQQDHRDIVRLTINGGQLDFQMYWGAGIGDHSSRGRGHEKYFSHFLPSTPASQVVLTLMQDGSP